MLNEHPARVLQARKEAGHSESQSRQESAPKFPGDGHSRPGRGTTPHLTSRTGLEISSSGEPRVLRQRQQVLRILLLLWGWQPSLLGRERGSGAQGWGLNSTISSYSLGLRAGYLPSLGLRFLPYKAGREYLLCVVLMMSRPWESKV